MSNAIKPTSKKQKPVPQYVKPVEGGEYSMNVHAFNNLASLVLNNYKTFSVFDFVALTRSLDIDRAEVQKMFNELVRQLTKENKIKQVNGCYEYDSYEVLTK
jgi:hypothetical protein